MGQHPRLRKRPPNMAVLSRPLAVFTVFLLAMFEGATASRARLSSCYATGCPVQAAVVCGADGNDYQNQCLATCQGVRVTHHGPCAHAPHHKKRHSSLHRLLSEYQPSTSADGYSDSVLGLLSPASGSEVLTVEHMDSFSGEGFRLLGKINLEDAAPPSSGSSGNTQAPQVPLDQLMRARAAAQQQGSGTKYGALSTSSASSEEEDDYASGDAGSSSGGSSSSSTGSSSTQVRALRITRDGLLYSASYDLEDMASQLKALAQDAGLTSASGQASGGSSSSTGSSSTPASADWSGFPDLPSFDPSETASTADSNGTDAADGSSGSSSAAAAGVSRARRHSRQLLGAVFQPDMRTECPNNPIGFPYSAVGQLMLRDASGAFVCSGALVGPDAVLTAGHCAFRRDGNGGGAFYSSLDFAPGRYRTSAGKVANPFNVTKWAWATIFDTYQTVPDSWQFDWDVAIIRLSEQVGKRAGWLGLAASCNANVGQNVSTAGYPADHTYGTCTRESCSMVQDACTGRVAYHTCSCYSGQSGSPMYNSRYQVRGVMVGSYSTSAYTVNAAHVIGPDTYTAVLKWIAETGPSQAGSGYSSAAAAAAVSSSSTGNATAAGGAPPPPGALVSGTELDVSNSTATGGNSTQLPPPPPAAWPVPLQPQPVANGTYLNGTGTGEGQNQTLPNPPLPTPPPPPSPAQLPPSSPSVPPPSRPPSPSPARPSLPPSPPLQPPASPPTSPSLSSPPPPPGDKEEGDDGGDDDDDDDDEDDEDEDGKGKKNKGRRPRSNGQEGYYDYSYEDDAGNATAVASGSGPGSSSSGVSVVDAGDLGNATATADSSGIAAGADAGDDDDGAGDGMESAAAPADGSTGLLDSLVSGISAAAAALWDHGDTRVVPGPVPDEVRAASMHRRLGGHVHVQL